MRCGVEAMNQKGQGIIIATIIVTFILLGLSAALLTDTITHNLASFGDIDRRQALQAAEAGIEEAKLKLARNPVAACADLSPIDGLCDTLTEFTSLGVLDVTYKFQFLPALPAAGSTTDTAITAEGRAGGARRQLKVVVRINDKGKVSQILRTEESPVD